METVDETIVRLRSVFSENLNWLELFANEVLPNLNSLPRVAMDFVMSIFGSEEIPPARHAEIALNHFVPISSSLRFASLAHQLLPGTDRYQFRLRYFGGLGDEDDKNLSRRNNPDATVALFIRSFFTSIFNNPEHAPVEMCVNRARSLFITVQCNNGQQRKDEKENKERVDLIDFPYQETIVSCINFSIMKPHGFFINWLATSNETISPRKYGEELMLVLSDQSWQRRNFAFFLLKLANFSVILHLRLSGILSADYNIVLQARSTEPAARFYIACGFDEGGPASSETDLERDVFQGFNSSLYNAVKSKTDFIHVIWDNDEIVWFTNKTGSFRKGKSVGKEFRTLVSSQDPEEFIFPFAAIREHLMLLATNLDFFYLPFQDSAPMHDFIQPNEFVPNRQRTFVCEVDRDSVAAKGSRSSGHLTDNAINFFIRW